MTTRITKRVAATGIAAALFAVARSLHQGRLQHHEPGDVGQRHDGVGDVDAQRRQQGRAGRRSQQIVNDYNASQTKYKVDVQAFPQDSYNQSVVAAAAAKKLPCILDIDGPNVPNWAWAGYLAPLEGMDDTLSKFLPSRARQVERQDLLLRLLRRRPDHGDPQVRPARSTASGSRPIDQPWTKDEFTAALKKIKRLRRLRLPRSTSPPASPASGGPTPTRPFLQSFGGDLINRTDYKSAEGVLNGPEARGVGQVVPRPGHRRVHRRSSPAPTRPRTSSTARSAILYNGSWAAADARKQFGDDIAVPARRRTSARARRSAAARGSGASPPDCSSTRRRDGLHEVRRRRTSTSPRSPRPRRNIPATDAAAAHGARLRGRAARTTSSVSSPRSSRCCGPRPRATRSSRPSSPRPRRTS